MNNSPSTPQNVDEAIDLSLQQASLDRYFPNKEKNKVVLASEKWFLNLIEFERKKFDVETPVFVGFANTYEFNAFANVSIHDVICVYAGTVIALWNAPNYLLSDPDFLSFIDSGAEQPDHEPRASKTFVEYCTSTPTRHPKGKRRQDLAGALWARVNYFVLTHELTHIFGGHVDLDQNRFGVVPRYEVQSHNRKLSDVMIDHALEYQADVYASIRGVEASAFNKSLSKFTDDLCSIQDFKESHDELSADLFFEFMAMYIYFRLTDQQYDVSKIQTTSHPLAAVRQKYLNSIIPAHALRAQYTQITPEQWVNIAYHCMEEVELAFGRFSNPNFSKKDLLNTAFVKAMFSDDQAYMNNLHTTLDSIKEDLDASCRGSFRWFGWPWLNK